MQPAAICELYIYVYEYIYIYIYEGKGKVHPRTGHEGPKGEQRYSSTLSLTSALDGWVVNATPRQLYPRERLGTHCIGGWVGHSSCLDGLYICIYIYIYIYIYYKIYTVI